MNALKFFELLEATGYKCEQVNGKYYLKKNKLLTFARTLSNAENILLNEYKRKFGKEYQCNEI